MLSTPILAKPSNGTLPSFLLPPSKRRQLVLTDLPRLLVIKEDEHTNAPKVKTEFFFVTHGKSIKIAAQLRKDGSAPAGEDDDRPVNIILELHEKGNRMFLLQTVSFSQLVKRLTCRLRKRSHTRPRRRTCARRGCTP